MVLREALGFGEDDDEAESLEDLERKKKRLEKKARVKAAKTKLDKLRENEGGVLNKLEGIAADLGKGGSSRALNHLVGPPERAEQTSEFVVGSSISGANSGSVPDFLLGDNNPERNQDIGVDFPIKRKEDGDEFDEIRKEMTEV